MWQEKELWLEAVRENWEQIMQVRCYISSAMLNCTFDFEPQHDWVGLRIQAPSRSRVVEITQELEERLGLQSRLPARSAGVYTVQLLRNGHG